MARRKPSSRKSSLRPDACVVTPPGYYDIQLTSKQCKLFPPGKWLGSGAFAAAYEKRGDPKKVVKFTSDKADASVAKLIEGKKTKRLVRVAQVRKLENPKNVGGRAVQGGIYAIESERLVPADGKLDRTALDVLDRVLDDYSHYRDRGEINPSETVSSVLSSRETFKLCKASSACKKNLKDMILAVDEAIKLGFFTQDLHGGNWGFRNKDTVILDFGLSKTNKRVPEIALAGLRRRGMGRRRR